MHLTGAWILLIFRGVPHHGSNAPPSARRTAWRPGSYATCPTVRVAGCFVASVSFFMHFLGVRSVSSPPSPITLARSDGCTLGRRHIHHLVWGILILLAVGYAWLAEVGTGSSPYSIFLSRLLAILYGVGALLTLDEFALWLNLANVYWSPQGRESIDAVILFGAALAAGAWGAPLFSALKRKS